jgi:diguanylate cyclase (GGDEF)-like protein
MPIDSFTVLFCGIFIKAVLAVLFLAFWLDDRRARWFSWWGVAFVLGSMTSALFMMRGRLPDEVTIGIGNTILIAVFACVWNGSRSFDGRRPFWLPVIVAPAIWAAACAVPGFMASVELRILVSSSLVGSLLALSAVEFWRGRGEALPSRGPVVAMFCSFAVLFFIRIPLMNVLPFPFGALPMHPGWLGAFNLIMFFHTIILTVLIVAMSKERLELEQRTKAQTDPLTGALNRRAFSLRCARLMQRHEREGQPLCLLYLDLDRFKPVNDRHGHGGGDKVLMEVVATIHNTVRATDLLFRFGGEEFCCLLPYSDGMQGVQIADRIRSAIEAQSVELPHATVRVTVSIGVSSTVTSDYDVDVLMRRADLALYEAKSQGRNRVAMAPERPTPHLVPAAAVA